jgi:hypothetical protein
MEHFETGYTYIDDRLTDIRKQLDENSQKELDYAIKKVHSLGIDQGYSVGLKSKELYESTLKK